MAKVKKHWQIRHVHLSTIKVIKDYAKQNGMTIAGALKALVERQK